MFFGIVTAEDLGVSKRLQAFTVGVPTGETIALAADRIVEDLLCDLLVQGFFTQTISVLIGERDLFCFFSAA